MFILRRLVLPLRKSWGTLDSGVCDVGQGCQAHPRSCGTRNIFGCCLWSIRACLAGGLTTSGVLAQASFKPVLGISSATAAKSDLLASGPLAWISVFWAPGNGMTWVQMLVSAMSSFVSSPWASVSRFLPWHSEIASLNYVWYNEAY